jgi:hypothetical protein
MVKSTKLYISYWVPGFNNGLYQKSLPIPSWTYVNEIIPPIKTQPRLNNSTISFFAASSSLGVQSIAEIEYEPVCVSIPKKR